LLSTGKAFQDRGEENAADERGRKKYLRAFGTERDDTLEQRRKRRRLCRPGGSGGGRN
jgi:hypothetical protein